MSTNQAIPGTGTATAPVSARYLVIVVDGDRYGLPLPQVREVLRAVWVTTLPDAPAIVMGLIDVRGRFVPVVDIRRRFGRAAPDLAPSERFVLAWTGVREVALRADSVEWMDDVPSESHEAVVDVIRRDTFVTGLAHTPDGLLLIQDLAGFLTEAESADLEHALAELAIAGAQ